MKFSTNDYKKSSLDFTLFKQLIKYTFPNINTENIEYLNELFNVINKVKIRGSVHFTKIFRNYFRNVRNNKLVSDSSVIYWTSLGWDEKAAIEKIKKIQSKKSHLTIQYWINKGYTIENANKKISEVQSNNSNKRYEKYTKKELSEQSVWSKSHWVKKGLSEEDAEYQANKRNYAKREFWKSDQEYEEVKKIIGKKTSEFIKNNPEKYKSFFGSTSKEEIEFFNYIKKHINSINHNQFIINVKESLELNQGIIKYDGYIKYDNNVILIEYDGLYWHNQSYDEIKDYVALNIRNDILGIIRISCKQFKTNKNNLIKLIKDGIKKIKSKESNRIKIY